MFEKYTLWDKIKDMFIEEDSILCTVIVFIIFAPVLIVKNIGEIVDSIPSLILLLIVFGIYFL